MRMITKTCTHCNEKYEIYPSREKIYISRFCSASCKFTAINKERTKLVTVPCIGCGIERTYSVYKKDSLLINKYCSKQCYRTHQHDRLAEQCRKIGNEFADVIGAKAKERFSNKENHPMFGKHHSEKSKKQLSETRKKNGKSKGFKNPMFGKTHTEEARLKISDANVNRVLNGSFTKNRIFETGFIFSAKMNIELFYRSSWEREYIKFLDRNNNVISFTKEKDKIAYINTDDHKRWYIPDFLIEYKNGNKELIEIKPSCYLKHEVNKRKFKAAREFCKENNMSFKVITEKYLKRIGII